MDSFSLAALLIGLTMVLVSGGLYILDRRGRRALRPAEPEASQEDDGAGLDERAAAAFTDAVMARLGERLGGEGVVLNRQNILQFEVVARQGEPIMVPVGRLMVACQNNPAQAEASIEAFLGGLVALLSEADPSRMGWEEAQRALLPEMALRPTAASEQGVSFPFGHDLEVRLVVPSARRALVVTTAHLERWAVRPEQARKAALANLARRSAEVPLMEHRDEGANTLYIYESQDGFDASRILLEDRWRELVERHEGRLLIAIPSRNFLIAFTDSNPEHGEHIRARVLDDWMDDESGRLTWKLFEATYEGVRPYEVTLH